VRMPTFSRQTTATDTDDRPAGGTAPVRQRTESSHAVTPPSDETTTRYTTAGGSIDRDRKTARTDDTTRDLRPVPATDLTDTREETPVRRPRASLLATLGLILAVVSVLLVLSGPLLGYGIGVAVLALVLSLSGLHATGKRHVAGKSDALIGTFVALGAIVLGVFALLGQIYWLGTDTQPVTQLREWLDAQFVNRF
jgi:hypothetical protein